MRHRPPPRVLPISLALAVALASAESGAAPRPAIKHWFVDALDKVFPDDPPGTKRLAEPVFHAARRSMFSVQLALRAARGNVAGVDVKALPLRGTSGAIDAVEARWVDNVEVSSNVGNTPDEELVRKAPGLFPDPLREDFPFTLEAEQTRSLWLTITVPAGAKPGEYKGAIEIRAGDAPVLRAPYRVVVYKATVPDPIGLYVENYYASSMARRYGLKPFSDEWWRLYENVARFLARHHQSFIWVSPIELAQADVVDGQIRFDFSRFERFVDLFEKAGIRWLEGHNLLSREPRPNGPMHVQAWIVQGGQAVSRRLPRTDPEAQKFLNAFLPALYRKLEERGWTERYLQGIMDEPEPTEQQGYTETAALVRKHMPKVRLIQPVVLTQDVEFMKPVHVWVAHLKTVERGAEHLKRHLDEGGEVWFYTALNPRGRYPNRFIDFSLLKVRILHWMNFTTGYRGYLHWGLNYWSGDPHHIKPGRLPAGDAWITYPNPEKLSLLSSLRFEQMAEGIEDFGLLDELSKKDPEQARRLAHQAAPSFENYVRSPKEFRKIHQQLLRALSSIEARAAAAGAPLR